METMPDFCLPLTTLLTTKEQLGLVSIRSIQSFARRRRSNAPLHSFQSTLNNARSSPNVFTEEPEPILMNSMVLIGLRGHCSLRISIESNILFRFHFQNENSSNSSELLA